MEEEKRRLIMYEKLMAEIDLGIHAIDDSGKTVIYNQKISDIENMNPQEVLHKPVREVFKFNEGQGSTLHRAMTEGYDFRDEKQTYFNNKGVEITTVNNTFPVMHHGEVIGALEVTKDITRLKRLVQENMNNGTRRYRFQDIIGRSEPLEEVIEHAKRATRTNSSVLIVGETGTGKELFAQSIHNESSRSAGPFVSQNCAALPESLIEGILFGTAKGAFTGAENRPGLFEQAEGGTLLLDEMNSLSPDLQSKLLRVIQEKTVRRVGDTKERKIDIRLLATMNEDPVDAITNGRLRKDLYYRLSVVSLFVPPLRERMEDLAPLSEYFISKYNDLFQLEVEGISTEVRKLLASYHWPGNIRELEHVIEGAMNLITEEKYIEFTHLPLQFKRKRPRPPEHNEIFHEEESTPLLKDYLFQQEKTFMQRVLKEHNYRVQETAAAIGISRQSLQYRMKKLGIQKIRE
ncbi:sigma-54 interaction domain-containing protein [Alkalicoccus daliensis]|uniref:Arginine utilization regulatory protein n=1 Tax=Alkalicoccus daliensis TaxID=745820 RepID=A0A1H0ETX5_9BACI|nr:sigma 54-interacting transcriptional regulator [Alkalicoccus daliensis]SDN85810.1 arginine utilization regulatory protein [Alkalicoccus daliensis]